MPDPSDFPKPLITLAPRLSTSVLLKPTIDQVVETEDVYRFYPPEAEGHWRTS
jgi:hypothetical protein